MTDRLASGSQRLDEILGGGLPANGLNLVVGVPGAGKTMVVQQYAFHNATRERPALYFSTVSEPFDKIVRYGQTLSFFDPAAVGQSVFYEDLGQPLTRSGLTAVLDTVDESIRRRRPGVVVIDSFRPLRAYSDGEDFRRFLHDLAGRASAFPASHFWVGEYTEADMTWAPEFAVADAILALSSESAGQRTRRELTVLKLRGSDFLSGRHAYRLGVDGIDVFPRLADVARTDEYALVQERESSGVPALDVLLAEGYRTGSTTLVAGPTGAGKTLLGLHFIFNGIRAGQPGIIASLQENPSQLGRVMTGFGWSAHEEGLETIYASPVDLYIDEWVYRLLDRAKQIGAKRLLVDSVTDLGFAVPDSVRFREYLYSLGQRCSRAGISLMMTLEVERLFDPEYVGTEGVSHLADNVLLLAYRRGDGASLQRAVTVLKARATRLVPQTREYRIDDGGFQLVG